MKGNKFSIIGLGLIGGSLAKALHNRLDACDITAIDSNSESIRQALRDGVIARGFDTMNEFVWSSDVVFICTPVKYIHQHLETLAANVKPDCIVTDVGSTKAETIHYVNSMKKSLDFIGGHPMAGMEKAGYLASIPHLFENAYYILTPSKHTKKSSLAYMKDLVKHIGGIPITLDAHLHDKITAGISHVPHIIASALVNLVREMDPDTGGKMQLLAAGGFKDITRIASSNPEVWESIILSNKKEAENILDLYIQILRDIKKHIRDCDSRNIYDFFEAARDYRDSFAADKRSLIPPLFEIIIDVVDKPGIIGEIATILGENGINIKNINVSNSREFEQGCLRITLPDSESTKKALRLLLASGYRAFKID